MILIFFKKNKMMVLINQLKFQQINKNKKIKNLFTFSKKQENLLLYQIFLEWLDIQQRVAKMVVFKWAHKFLTDLMYVQRKKKIQMILIMNNLVDLYRYTRGQKLLFKNQGRRYLLLLQKILQYYNQVINVLFLLNNFTSLQILL